MKTKELREMTVDELEKQLVSLKEELFNLRFQLATGQLDNPMRVRDVRKSIARVKTILHEQQLKAGQA
ncbi:MAG: 50S ribosomal protein L29 [Firmicutes bacterium]|nr:50S ribosomal protein L29 [Bacillota bacterium]